MNNKQRGLYIIVMDSYAGWSTPWKPTDELHTAIDNVQDSIGYGGLRRRVALLQMLNVVLTTAHDFRIFAAACSVLLDELSKDEVHNHEPQPQF